jgi:DNA-binding Lrp family transcriptional regulator
MSSASLDDVDREILFVLQKDARNTTIAEIAEEVGVSSSTVRNRIESLEDEGVIEGYYPKINYEKASFPLHVMFICSAPADEREQLARSALDSPGVVDVTEMITSANNLYVEAVATATKNLTVISNELADLGFGVESSEIIANDYTKPWAHFEYDSENP